MHRSSSTRFPLGSGYMLAAVCTRRCSSWGVLSLASLSSGDCGGHQGGSSAVMQQGTFHVPVNSAQMTLIPHYSRISPLKPLAAMTATALFAGMLPNWLLLTRLNFKL